jgi:hypothetical protein
MSDPSWELSYQKVLNLAKDRRHGRKFETLPYVMFLHGLNMPEILGSPELHLLLITSLEVRDQETFSEMARWARVYNVDAILGGWEVWGCFPCTFSE